MGIIKIDHLAFIRDLIIRERLTDCNLNVILMQTRLLIEIEDPKNYTKINLQTYQQLIGKQIYLAYGTWPDIAFVVRQFSKYNANPRKRHPQATKKVV